MVLQGGATTFPPPIARAACWDVDLEERIGEAIAREARAFGANWLAAVCVNLLRHPGWGRAQETYGEDPVLLGALGAAMTRRIQRHAVACVKHFALNSIDSSRFLVDVQVSERLQPGEWRVVRPAPRAAQRNPQAALGILGLRGHRFHLRGARWRGGAAGRPGPGNALPHDLCRLPGCCRC